MLAGSKVLPGRISILIAKLPDDASKMFFGTQSQIYVLFFIGKFFYTKYNHTQGYWFEWKISLLMVLSANDNHASEFEELFFFLYNQ